ncbi:MAG: hypothetical protein ABIE84_06910 [bacterium]
MYASVLLARASKNIDKIFSYSIPTELEGKLQIGHQVLVPFGPRQDIGYVVGLVEKAEVKKTRDIIKLGNPVPGFSDKQLELARWISEYYFSCFGTEIGDGGGGC